MIKKLLALGLGYAFRQLNTRSRPMEYVTAAMALKIRKLIMLSALLLSSAVGFALTLTFTLKTLGENMDLHGGYLVYSNTLLFSSLALAAFIGLFIYAILPKNWVSEWGTIAHQAYDIRKDHVKSAQMNSTSYDSSLAKEWDSSVKSSSPLEEIVSAFVDEYQQRRQARQHHHKHDYNSVHRTYNNVYS